ncbi:MAG: dUTP diphosphatase [Candidatus Neomarinimicrobiota bacterium]|jgi:dUTP pyrophosphatase|tara:strand:+ start:1948 stop:2385 length:438 start_codon:yes stop_codon:yes gene_type:complete
MKLRIKAFNDRAKELYENHSHFHSGDAGLDLFVVEDQIIPAKSTQPIPLQIACENLDKKAYYLFPRSSISKTPLRLANSIGLIDGGYRGELVGMVDNIYDEDFHVKRGERYFQLVAVDSSPIDFELVEELSESSRGEGGFGSTGR